MAGSIRYSRSDMAGSIRYSRSDMAGSIRYSRSGTWRIYGSTESVERWTEY